MSDCALSPDLFSVSTSCGPFSPWEGPPPDRVTFIRAKVGGPDGPTKTFRGRFAWTLAHLIDAGMAGITSFERPAPRWSHYIYRLRREGVGISMQEEKHGGDYSGWHGRYRLTVPVEVLETKASEAA